MKKIRAAIVAATVALALAGAPAALAATIAVESCWEGGPRGNIIVAGIEENQEVRIYPAGSAEYATIPPFGGGMLAAPGDYLVEVYEVLVDDVPAENLLQSETVTVAPCAEPTGAVSPKPAVRDNGPLPETSTAPEQGAANPDGVLVVIVLAVAFLIGFSIRPRRP